MPLFLDSPSTDNLYLGKGIGYFQLDGVGSFRDLGNIPDIELTLTIENLEHFSSREGTRLKDKIFTLSRGGKVRWVMEEWTPDNLALWGLGDVNLLAVGGPIFDIMSTDSVSGTFKFTGANEIGPNYEVILFNVRITPTQSIKLINDTTLGVAEVTGEILIGALSGVSGRFGTIQLINSHA